MIKHMLECKARTVANMAVTANFAVISGMAKGIPYLEYSDGKKVYGD